MIADTMKKLREYWTKRTMRERVIMFITALVVLSMLFYRFPYLMQKKAVTSLGVQITATEKEILDLTSQVTELKSRAEKIKDLDIPAIRGKRLSDQKGVVLFLEDVDEPVDKIGGNRCAGEVPISLPFRLHLGTVYRIGASARCRIVVVVDPDTLDMLQRRRSRHAETDPNIRCGWTGSTSRVLAQRRSARSLRR